MYERLIEHWLTSVNELSFQLPFCEVLLAEGYEIMHVSTHGRGEHGKDVIARRADGALCSFQLKGGDIALSEWRSIRGEIEELVQLPVRLPGIDEAERHIPHLVTNGELRGDAVESVKRYSDKWEGQGHPGLIVWQKNTLLRMFVDAQGTYLPMGLHDFRSFVELYIGEFDESFPKEKLSQLLNALVGPDRVGDTDIRRMRTLAALAVVAGYVIEQYERVGNYIAALEGWTVVATSIFRAAERYKLGAERYEPSLAILELAFWRNAEKLEKEVLDSNSFLGTEANLAAGIVYGARTMILLGWVSAIQLLRFRFPSDSTVTPSPTATWRRFLLVIRREITGLRFTGEIDWPCIMSIAWFLEIAQSTEEAEALLGFWIRWILEQNRGDKAEGVAPPHWTYEKIFKSAYGLLPQSENERFAPHSYTVMSALDMLVRRLRRQSVAAFWPAVTRLDCCDFSPDSSADWFVWKARTGRLLNGKPEPTAHWNTWRTSTGQVQAEEVPGVISSHPQWLLPYLLTFAHRANRASSAFADAIVARRARIVR